MQASVAIATFSVKFIIIIHFCESFYLGFTDFLDEQQDISTLQEVLLNKKGIEHLKINK